MLLNAMTQQELQDDFPELTFKDILAVLACVNNWPTHSGISERYAIHS